jgi:hypothetical protein
MCNRAIDASRVQEYSSSSLNKEIVMAEIQTVTGVLNPSARSSEPVGHFEDECVNLLCRQENALTLLSEASRKRRPLDSLDLAKKMLVQFLDFAESHFEPVQMQIVGKSLYVVNQLTQQYEKMLVANWYRFFRRMVFLPVPTEAELREAHNQLRSEYMELYNAFFAICGRRFPKDSDIQQQFNQSVETFLVEFAERW